MWSLDPSWRNLAAGCERAAQLESTLRQRWSASIPQAEQRALSRQRERFTERRAGWEQRNATARERFAQERSAWQGRETARQSTFDRLWREWSTQDSLHRRRLWRWAFIALAAWLAITLAGLAVGPLSPAHIGISCFAALCGGFAMLVPTRDLLAHRAQQPVYPAGDPEPVEQFEAEPVDPGLDRQDVSLELTTRWWRGVHADPHRSRQSYAHGDEGVSRFIEALSTTLSSDFFVARDLLVAKSLDVDVLIVGPSGVWVFEVKHWSGRIVCSNGAWRRERTYYEAGGFEATDVKQINAFDRQWQREVGAVATTLRRRLKPPIASALTARGGLVFSHRDADLQIDRTCGAAYGPPEDWVNTVARAPSLPAFSQHEQLRTLDALFSWSRKLETVDDSRCAERLATELHDKIDIVATDYIRRLDAT